MKKRHGFLFKATLFLSVILLLTAILTVVILEPRFKIYGWEELDETKLIKAEKTVNFLDANDNNIENLVYDTNKTYVKLDKIPRHVVDAFVSIEDKRFYSHKGVDYKRIAGAILNNVKSLSFKEGASTISQQLIKNTHLSGDKKISRKIKEIRIARDLERKYSKDEIMEMYLNILYFGDNIYGINTAAKVYFGVEPSALSLSQSALLAGIINNPAKYNPYRNPENAERRRDLVLLQMMKIGKIDDRQFERAKAEDIVVHRDDNYSYQYLNGIIAEAQDILKISRKELLARKLTIGTYYDKDLNRAVKRILKESDIPSDADGHVVIIKNSDGRLIADAGLKNFNLARLKRQPGSAVKPLLCYAPALEKGDVYCCSPIEDVPTQFTGGYFPSNYNDKYWGWTTVENALAHSLNVPAVKLLEKSGVEYSKSVCQGAGLDFHPNDNNLALALGGMTEGWTLRELSGAYRMLADSGFYVKEAGIKYILDERGHQIFCRRADKTGVISADTAYLVGTMLKKCVEEGTAKRLSGLNNVCAKTGTVGDKSGNTDLYCMAYTPNYTVGVWIGCGEKKMPNNVTSGALACEIARRVLNIIGDSDVFSKPETVKCRYIDLKELKQNHRVLLAGNDVALKDKVPAWFSESNMPTEYSTPQFDFYYGYDDFLGLDFDNFKIIQDFLD